MFKKAQLLNIKPKIAIYGASGSGKTYTSLEIAKGIGGKIAVIDSEHGSASRYADRFDFDVAELSEYSVKSYINTIKEAENAGYDVIIIDSLTHAWNYLLEENEKLAKTKYRGNTWSAWSETNLLQKELMQAVNASSCTIITTMRSKTAWETSENNGRKSMQKVGLSPEQGKGFEYEFDMLFSITPEHILTVEKDRSGRLQDEILKSPNSSLGKRINEWTKGGIEAPKVDKVDNSLAQRKEVYINNLDGILFKDTANGDQSIARQDFKIRLEKAKSLDELKSIGAEIKAKKAE